MKKDMPKEFRDGFSAISIIVLIVILTLLIVGGFFGYQYLQLQKIRDEAKAPAAGPPATPSAQTQPQTVETDTSNWKTYRNEKYGFEFKYPKNAYLQEDNNGDNIFVVFRLKASSGRDIYFTFGVDNTAPKTLITIEEIKVQYPEKSSRYVTIGTEQWLERIDGGCEGGSCSADFFYYHDRFLRKNRDNGKTGGLILI